MAASLPENNLLPLFVGKFSRDFLRYSKIGRFDERVDGSIATKVAQWATSGCSRP